MVINKSLLSLFIFAGCTVIFLCTPSIGTVNAEIQPFIFDDPSQMNSPVTESVEYTENSSFISSDTQSDNLTATDYMIQGNLNFKAGNFESALIAYDALLEIEPVSVDGWYSKGLTLRSLNRKEEAIEAYNKGIEIEPNNVQLLIEKLHVLEEMNQETEIIQTIVSLIATKNPETIPIIYEKIDEFTYLGKTDVVLQMYDTLSDVYPDDNAYLIDKGIFFETQLNQSEEALLVYEKAITIDPTDEIAWFNKASSLYNLGRYSEAVEACEKVNEYDPNPIFPGQIDVIMANSLYYLGQYEEADAAKVVAIASGYGDGLIEPLKNNP